MELSLLRNHKEFQMESMYNFGFNSVTFFVIFFKHVYLKPYLWECSQLTDQLIQPDGEINIYFILSTETKLNI